MINETFIEKYFSNTLSPDEILEFENLYKTDPEFSQEIDFLKNVKVVAEKEDDDQFKKQMASYEIEAPKNQEKPINWVKFLVAASVIVMIFSISFLWTNTKSDEELFVAYFEPSKNVSAPIVRSENDETLVNNAFIAYNKGNYIEALPLFEKSFKETNNSELLFYEGNALLALGNAPKAIEKFKQHLTYSNALTQRSHWYLAMAYLKMNETEKAKTALNALIDSGEKFKNEEAKSLLKDLD